MRSLLLAALLLPSTAWACPVAGELQDGGPWIRPGDVEALRDQLAATPPGLCADALRDALIEHQRPRFVQMAVEITTPWPRDQALPWLLDAWGAAYFYPGGRREDALEALTRGVEARLGDEQVVSLLRSRTLDVDWPERARSSYVEDWGPGLSMEPPPRDEAFDAAVSEAWADCLAEPDEVPPDPFDPLGLRGGTFGQLALGGRCASAAVLRVWGRGDPAWAEESNGMIRQYSQAQSALGDMTVRQEQRWGQGSAPGTGQRIASPDEPLPPDPVLRALQAYGAFVLLALLVSAPKKTRLLGFPLLAVAFGLGLVLLAEVVLRLQDTLPGDASRPRTDFVINTTATPDQVLWYLDQRAWPVTVDKPEGTVRIAVVGASSVVGPGLGTHETITGHLKTKLQPEVPCLEVINLGVHGAASPTFRTLAAMATEQLGLDAVVLYGGHNEVADTREAGRYFDLDPDRLRLRAALTRLALWGVLSRWLDVGTELPALSEEQLQAAQEAPPRDFSRHQPRFSATVSARAEREFVDLARDLKRRDVPLIIALPSFNHHGLRVSLPGSVEGVPLEPLKARLEDNPQEALALAEDAVEKAPEHAGLWTLLSLARELSGDLDGAEVAIQEAARRNHKGSAVTPGVVAALRRAAEHHGVLVDAHAALHVEAGPHLPGFDLFVDFVHLNPRGAGVVAASIAAGAREAGLVRDWSARCPVP